MKKVYILLVFITAILQGQPDTLWTTTFGDSNSHAGRALDVTSDGGYITTGFSGTPYDLLLVKFDSQGNEEWNNIYIGDGGNLSMFKKGTENSSKKMPQKNISSVN